MHFNEQYDNAFEKLLGRLPTIEERERAYRLRDILGADLTEATWGIFVGLQYHLVLYEQIPEQIETLVRGMNLDSVREAAHAGAATGVGDIMRGADELLAKTAFPHLGRAIKYYLTIVDSSWKGLIKQNTVAVASASIFLFVAGALFGIWADEFIHHRVQPAVYHKQTSPAPRRVR
jgi:hypothetical protein